MSLTPVLLVAGIAVGIPVGHYYWLYLTEAYAKAAPVVSRAVSRAVAWVKSKVH